MSAYEFFSFIDYYKNKFNVKNDSITNNYELFFLTSIESPDELFQNIQKQEPKKQWFNILKFIHIVNGKETN